jgi:hypothetical protein
MWSKDSQLYFLSWFGTIVGVFGLVVSVIAIVHPEGFPISAGQLAYIGGSSLIVGAATIGIWRWLAAAITRPDIETISVTKALNILDSTGNDAILIRTEENRANRKTLSHTLTVGGIAATGDIKEIKIDGEVIPNSEWELVVKQYRVVKILRRPFNPGEQFNRLCEMRIANSFPKKKETLVHEVSQQLRKLVLEVTFPAARKPTDIRGYLAFGDQTHAGLSAPARSPDGRTFTIPIKRPQLGGSYRIEWEW